MTNNKDHNIILGNMFKQMREEKKLSQEQVSKNLLAQRTLSGFEKNGEMPNFLLLNAIVQRIGCSMDYFMTMITKEEYDYLIWRKNTIEQLEYGDLEEGYWSTSMATNRRIQPKLQEQFATFWQGYSEENTHKMKKAIQLTIDPQFFHLSDHVCVSAEEIYYILIYIEKGLTSQPNGWRQYKCLLLHVIHYVETRFEKVQQIKVYGKAICLYGKYIHDIDIEEKIFRYKKVLDLHRELAQLHYTEDILQELIGAYDKLGNGLANQYKKYLFALKFVRENIDKPKKNIIHLDFMNEYYIYHEVLKLYRVENKYNIHTIADLTCSEKTYRAIEGGKRKAKKGTFDVLVEALQIPLGIHNSDIVTDNYKDLKLAEHIKILRRNRQIDQSMKELDELESSLGEKKQIVQNVQFIDQMRDMDSLERELIDPMLFIERTKKRLCMTMCNFESIQSPHFYTRNEMIMLIHIAIAYRKIKENESSIEILEILWNQIDESIMDNIYRQDEILLILRLWKNLLTDQKNYEEATIKTYKGIQSCIEVGRGDKISAFIFELGWILERKTTSENKENIRHMAKKYFECALTLNELFLNFQERDIAYDYLSTHNYL